MLVRLLIDNQVVVSRLGVEKWNFGVLLPEHFPTKKTDWQPALDRGLTAKQRIHLNQVADAAAGAAVKVTEILKEDERGINMKFLKPTSGHNKSWIASTM
jgi:hypothetical protein